MRHFLKPTFCTLYYHSGQSDNILPQPGFDPTILDNNDQNWPLWFQVGNVHNAFANSKKTPMNGCLSFGQTPSFRLSKAEAKSDWEITYVTNGW